ncbi:MAG: hypothetical protein L3J12_10565 [Spirochaetales bacterium]|nr:hypothetical protein [Spirochaetales bacterium]
MNIHSDSCEQTVLSTFCEKKILTIKELSGLLSCPDITSRRRLKQWKAHTSYNHNNRYYTLPSIPVFNKKGLWQYHGVFFSKHGTCKQTVVHLVHQSEKGLSNKELAEALGDNPNSLLAHFKEISGLKKERHSRDIVYFSSDEEVYRRQKRKKFPPEPAATELPPDAHSIIILVELIHYPGISIDELTAQLQGKGHTIGKGNIAALFKKHGITKKKQNTR